MKRCVEKISAEVNRAAGLLSGRRYEPKAMDSLLRMKGSPKLTINHE
jgi:hypothetical protein